MNLLIVAVGDPEHVEDFLSVLVDLDVGGLQIVDSSTVMEMLAREAPIFAGLRRLVMRPRAESKIILGIAERDGTLEELHRSLRKIGLDLERGNIGYALLLPIAQHIGQLGLDDD